MKNLTTFISLILIAFSCQNPTAKNSLTDSALSFTQPENVGMNADSLDLIEDHIQWAIDSQFIAGGVALVARHDQIVYHKAIGFKDRGKSDTLLSDHIFRMASMTKPITTVAVMQLVEQDKLSLNDPVSKYIPEFKEMMVIDNINEEDSSYTTVPAQNEMTIHHLLTHTSGLVYGVWDPYVGPAYREHNITEGWTKDSVTLETNIPNMGKAPLMHEPGARFTYGVSIDVLGRIVEIVSGKPLDEYFQENIFSPLGMKDTYFYLPEEKYDRLVDVWYTSDYDTSELPEFVGDDYPVNGYQTYFAGGAGLSSTSLDYYKFASALLNNGVWDDQRILKDETVQMMMSNQIDTLSLSDGEQFGYGGSVYTSDGPFGRKIGRFSWGGYWQTTFWIDPERDVIALLLTNARNTPKWNELFDGFEKIVNNSVVDLSL